MTAEKPQKKITFEATKRTAQIIKVDFQTKPEKPQTTTTIEIPIGTYDKLHSYQQRFDKIINPHGHKRPLSLGKTIDIILSLKSIDEQLSELM